MWAVAVAITLGTLPLSRGHVQALAPGVFYHDQSGDALQGISAAEATRLASRRLGFTVRLPALWPRGAPLRALWVMDRHTPRFVVIYYGGNDGYITCQLHESLHGATAALHWVSRQPISIGALRGVVLRSAIGGSNPVSELIWRAHGVYYDLLGSTSTPLALLRRMAASLT